MVDQMPEKTKDLAQAIFKHAVKKKEANSKYPKLKSGEDYYKDPASGEITGIQRAPTAKEIEEDAGRAYFNKLYPFINQGLSHYSGENSNLRFGKDALNFGKDKAATQRLLDFLVAKKLATAAVVKENATIGGNATRENYRNIRESLPAADINSYLEKFAKGFLLPNNANIDAGKLFSEKLNEAQKTAGAAIPARKTFLFNPQEEQEAGSQYSPEDIQETALKYGISPEDVIKRLQGGMR